MASIYVRSTDGSDADNGTTWALAKATLNGAGAIDAAGDTIYISQNHAESSASAITISPSGSVGNPSRWICGNDGAQPPTTSASSATVTTTGNNNITIDTGSCHMYGITFSAGSGANNTAILVGASQHQQTFDTCTFISGGSSGGGMGVSGSATGSNIIFKNCTFKISSTGGNFGANGKVRFDGGGMSASTTTPTGGYIGGNGAFCDIVYSGFDFSNFSSTVDLVIGGANLTTGSKVVLRNCKLPASWSGNLVHTTLSRKCFVEMHNCDSTNTRYRLWVEQLTGSVKTETTLVKTNGATDGTTPFSWKMVSNTNTQFPYTALESPELPAKYNTTTGSSVTVTVDILLDSASALNNDDIYLEVQYQGSSTTPLSTFTSSQKSDILGSNAALTSSSVTWTTTGMSNPNKLKMSVSFTPNGSGYIQAKVFLCKASTTVYVDPVIQVS